MTLLLLCALPAAGKECVDDYRLIGKIDAGFGSKKRQSFIFNNEKHRFGEEFHLVYPGFEGQLLPVRFERISNLEAGLRRRLKEIKTASRPNAKDEREVGEFVVKTSNGKVEFARFTSNDRMEISVDAQLRAVDEKDLFRNIKDITHFTDVHTHPNLGKNTDIFFSSGDLDGYFQIKRQIEAETGRPIHFRAIVLPNCGDCDDVALIMDF